MPLLNQFYETKTSRPTVAEKKMKIQLISYKKLEESKKQYREIPKEDVEELANLILLDGEVLQPLLVRKNGGDTFEIIAGHKRHKAVTYIVEELHEEKFAMMPCYVVELSDVRAEFALYSTNGYKNKPPYQIMKEIEGMKRLMESFPEEFPSKAKGRMVERIASEMGISKSTVGEYQNITHNLGKEGMDKFKSGEINKSAANSLASLPKEKQKELLDAGLTKDVDIKAATKKEEDDDLPTWNIQLLPDKYRKLVLYTFIGEHERERIAEVFARSGMRPSEQGQEILKILGTYKGMSCKEYSICSKRVGIEIILDNHNRHNSRRKYVASWRNIALWVGKELQAGRFLSEGVLPGQTSLPIESDIDDSDYEDIPENIEEPLKKPDSIKEVMLQDLYSVIGTVSCKQGICPACKEKVLQPFNKAFCGCCGTAINW